MSRGEYKLAVQRAAGAAFASVVPEVHEGADERFVIDASKVDEWGRAAVTFGVLYAHEGLTLPKRDHRKLRVVVEGLQTSNVDSNVMAVAFACIRQPAWPSA